MTMFNLNDEFNKLVKVTLLEKQVLTEKENKDSIQQEMIDESTKSLNFFQENKPPEKAE